jgi:hypothetical protein
MTKKPIRLLMKNRQLFLSAKPEKTNCQFPFALIRVNSRAKLPLFLFIPPHFPLPTHHSELSTLNPPFLPNAKQGWMLDRPKPTQQTALISLRANSCNSRATLPLHLNSSPDEKQAVVFIGECQRKPTANSLFAQIRVNSRATSPSS